MDTVAAKLQALAHTPDYDTSLVSLSARCEYVAEFSFFQITFPLMVFLVTM